MVRQASFLLLQAKEKPRNDIKGSGVIGPGSAVPPAASSGPARKGTHALGSKASTEAVAPSSYAPSAGAQSSAGQAHGAPAAGPKHIPAAGLAGARAPGVDTSTTAAANRWHITSASDRTETSNSVSSTSPVIVYQAQALCALAL